MEADTVVRVAPDYPDTWFGTPMNFPATWGAPFDVPNQFSYNPDSGQSHYLGGIVLGLATETNKIGYPVGYLFPHMWGTMNAFKQGVQSVNPGCEVIELEMLTWTDPVKGRETAEALIEVGCDVFSQLAGGAEAGLVEVLRDNQILSIAGAATETPGFNELNIGDSVYSMRYATADVIGIYMRDGTLENMPYSGGIARGWAYFIFEHPELAPMEAFQKVFIASQQIADGTIQIIYKPEPTPPDWGGPGST